MVKIGRPDKKATVKKAHKVSFRVTPLEYGLLKSAAEEKHTTISKLIRGYLVDFLSDKN